MMNTDFSKVRTTISVVPFLIGITGIIFVIILDKTYWQTYIFAEGWPNFSSDYLIRSGVIFISVFITLWSLIGKNKPTFLLSKNNKTSLIPFSIFSTLCFSIIIICLFIYAPETFSALSLEDGLIEWASALLLFGSFILMATSFLKTRNVIRLSKTIWFSLGFLSLAFFVLAMEEISWFQRQLEIDSPELFNSNWQGEMNLHNFATDKVENLYYFGSFFLLVILPFIRWLLPSITNNNYLKIFIPRPFIGVIGSIACAYNFDMWNIIFTQITFFGSVIVLFAYAVFSSNKNERYLFIFTILLIVITQALFLMNGSKFDRLWEVTEYKEFFIPLAFFIYTLDSFSYINHTYLPKKS